jgi:crotonobetainyl-CoA:carnitine CoA-transferase CaiB-like acyl-CoA transferase
VLSREGNQNPSADLQDVYRCAGDDAWIAITCVDATQVEALLGVTGPDVAAHCASRDPAELAEELMATGVPAGHVIPPRDVVHNPQLRHRGLFEMEHHPVTGDHELLAMPFRVNGEPAWSGRSSPTLGQHNAEILSEAGYSAEEIASLEAAGLIGIRPVGA